MTKADGKLRNAGEVAFCFLAAVILAVLALNLGLKTEPGKILPTGITMRSGEMNMNLLRGIDLAMEDIDLIRSGASGIDLWRLLTFVHFDLFFYIALLLPAAASKTVLLIGYYVRFGLCCSAMYYFLKKHINLQRLPAALLGVMYAFSSQIIFTAQFPALMNMAVMLPVLMSAFDSYLRKRTWKSYAVMCFSAFGLAASGGFGIIVGIPAAVFLGLVMCTGLYSKAGKVFSSWIRLISGLSAGLLMDMAFMVPGLTAMDTKINVVSSFSDAKVTYTAFDLLRGTFALRSGSLYDNGSPLFYIGMLTVAAVVVFAVNENIPLRLKVTSAVIAAVFHICNCSSFMNETLSIYGTAPAMSSARLICLEALVFFIAAVGLKNVQSLKRGDFIAVCLIPLAFLIVSNNSMTGTSFASSISTATFFAVIAEAFLVYALARNKLSGKGRYAVLAAGFVLVGINAAFIMFNNTISSSSATDYFRGSRLSLAPEGLITDDGFDLPAISDESKYIVIPADLSIYESQGYAIDSLNYLSYKVTGDDLFGIVPFDSDEREGLVNEGLDIYRLSEGMNEVVISPAVSLTDERLYLYCSAQDGAQVRIESVKGMSERVFTGAFITEIESYSDDFALDIVIMSGSERSCRISLYTLNEPVLDSMKVLSGDVPGPEFTVDITASERSVGTGTIILPYAYEKDTKVRINGEPHDTYNICGKMAVTFNCGDAETVSVKVGRQSAGSLPATLVSVFTALCLVAIPLLQRYNEKKKVTGEGNKADA